MRILQSLAGAAVLVVGVLTGQAHGIELKVLGVDASKPALQELAADFEKSSGHKLKIEYASSADVQKKISADDEYDVVILDQPAANKLTRDAKLVGGTTQVLFKVASPEMVYIGSSVYQTEQPIPAKALIDFLASAKAKDVYKAKGLQPG